MLFDLEVKTKKLERSHLIKNVYAHSDGKVLTLHLTNQDIYKPQLKIEPGCHVYHNGKEFTIQEFSLDRYLKLVLDKNPPTENYSIITSKCIHAPGNLEGNRLVLFLLSQHRELTDVSASATVTSSAMVKLTMERRLISSQKHTTSLCM